MKLSIIIPVYNVEKYVEQCIMSTQEQDLPSEDYEVIVINDGSPDNSLSIVEKLATMYHNIKVYSQPNQGLSAARNTGLGYAQGEYVWFVDSDDWIAENCLGPIMKDCYDNNLDGIIIQGVRVIDGVCSQNKAIYASDTIETGVAKMQNHMINCAAVKTIIKKKYFDEYNLKFFEGIYHEDQEFTPRMYYYLQRLKESEYYVYYNRLTANSITQSINPKKGFDLLKVANNIYSFALDISSNIKTPYYNFISSDLNQAFSNIVNADEETQQRFMQLLVDNKYILKCYLKSDILKYKLVGVLMNICPTRALSIYKLFKR